MPKHTAVTRRPGASPSRRRFLKAALGGAFLAGIFSWSEAQAAKITKRAANYQNMPRNNQRCSRCQFFIRPGSCQVVAGKIRPNAWCRLFKRG